MYSPVGAGTGLSERNRAYGTPIGSPTPRRQQTYMSSHLFSNKTQPEEESFNFRGETPTANQFLYPPVRTPSYSSISPSNHKLFGSEPRESPHKKDKDDSMPPVQSIYDSDLPLPETLKSDLSSESPSIRPEIRSAISPTIHQEMIFKESTPNPEIFDDRWVIVFGFPPQAVRDVLKQFEKYGVITRYRLGEGNWMNIQFQTKLEAQKALGKNGKILDGFMVGVVPGSGKLSHGTALATRSQFPSTTTQIQYSARNTSDYSVESIMPKTAPIQQDSWYSKVMQYLLGM